MKRKVFLSILIISILIFLVGCANFTSSTKEVKKDPNDLQIEDLQNQVKDYEKSTLELQNKIANYETQINYLNDEKDSYKKFIDTLIKRYTKSELLEMARDEWVYSIRVDETPIPSSGILEINTTTFKIIYSESQPPFSPLPQDIRNAGKIRGNYPDHLKILDIEPNNTTGSSGTIVDAAVYEYENVPHGSTIRLKISDELKKRMGLRTNVIRIVVK